MADVKNVAEGPELQQAMPTKRKADLTAVGSERQENDDSVKKHRLETSARENSSSVADESKRGDEDNDGKHENDELVKERVVESSGGPNSSSLAEESKLDGEDDGEDDEDDEADYEGEDDDDDEDSDEHSNGKPEVDRKGKGILKEKDKGKGKLIEESDDSSDGGSESSGDSSDLSDDPLAEVDLDNILPSRTRRRVHRPGINISNHPPNNVDDDGSDA
ncbi:uncharacterized protein LOC127799438 [Diospyros lotus]|uniref:uncharacterized protein LOC127799438 n=1 Tax=Diospyros lotus TaxID=55363 RepID=UPI00225C2AED|nr:uncharacterized protein LOC127799438 [Diospyros lotus]